MKDEGVVYFQHSENFRLLLNQRSSQKNVFVFIFVRRGIRDVDKNLESCICSIFECRPNIFEGCFVYLAIFILLVDESGTGYELDS